MASAFQDYFAADSLAESLKIRKVEPRDCFAALVEGYDDVVAMPTYPAFLGLFYALAGVTIVSLSSFVNALHLAFPLAAGFALVGPFVAVGLYEMSRRRELGRDVTWRDAFAALRSPALPSILALGFVLLMVFAVWIEAAQLLYVQIYGPRPPVAAIPFFHDVLTSGRGWLLIILGGAIGFCFAALALGISVVSFPLMLDRDVGFVPAVSASLRVSRENPAAVALWGFLVAAGLILGSLPLFIGLSAVMPVLGHATWRFYRRAIERASRVERPIDVRGSAKDSAERLDGAAETWPRTARRFPHAQGEWVLDRRTNIGRRLTSLRRSRPG